MVDVDQRVCVFCEGTLEQEMQEADGTVETVPCLCDGNDPEEQWALIRHMLTQFINCGECRNFDSDRGKWGKDCDGCKDDRMFVMNLAWHYGQLVLREARR
jgi:hypothetical protein